MALQASMTPLTWLHLASRHQCQNPRKGSIPNAGEEADFFSFSGTSWYYLRYSADGWLSGHVRTSEASDIMESSLRLNLGHDLN